MTAARPATTPRAIARLLRVALLAVVCLAVTGAAPVAPSVEGATGQVDRSLQTIVQRAPADVVRVIVQARSASQAAQALQRSAGQPRARLAAVGGLAGAVRADRVAALAREPGVVRVMFDAPMRSVHRPEPDLQPVSVFAQSVGAPALWAVGQRGHGVAIAVLDSGVQAQPDLGTPSRVVHSERFNDGASSSADQQGHGTWVAGIAAGAGTASGGRYSGMAPEASIVNLKVSDDTGTAYTSDVVQALGWVAANHARFNIRVVNLSLVSSEEEGYATNLLDAAVEMVWHAGVVVVVSAGNRGADSERYAPANDPYVITVGAADDMGTASPEDDGLAWFSSFGRTPDGFSKPDLVAPGRHIVGLLSSGGAALARQFPGRVIDQRYIQLSGTSGSAPVVSGAVAMLLQAHPSLTPDQVKWLLTGSAHAVLGAAQGAGAGELAVADAARLAEGARVGRANTGLIPNRLVALAYLSRTGSDVSWDSVAWDSVSWDSVAWDSVSWDSAAWDSVSWDSVAGDSVSWDSVVGDD
jgi:serine protease AprX